MGKKNSLIWAILLMILMGGTVFAEEKKSKEQIIQDVKERQQAAKEMKKKSKIQVIKGKEIQFLDDNRQIRKRISLERKIVKVKENVKVDNRNELWTFVQETYKSARINNSGQFAALITNVTNLGATDEKGNEAQINGTSVSGKIDLMDGKGAVIWSRELPDKKIVDEELFISENGEIVVAESSVILDEQPEHPEERFFVFDKTGKDILRFLSMRIERLSPNGKYLAVTVDHRHTLITRFYNLTNKKYWDADKEYVVFEITDNGISIVRENVKGSKVTDLDLKNFIGD